MKTIAKKLKNCKKINRELTKTIETNLSDSGTVTKVITEETTETITTTVASKKNGHESNFLKVHFTESEDECDEDIVETSFDPRLKIKSASQDSGFDEKDTKDMFNKVEKLEAVNLRLRHHEQSLINDLNEAPVIGAIGYSRDKNCLKYFDGSEINSMRSSLGLNPLSRSISNPASASTACMYYPPDRPGSVRSVVDNMRTKREMGGNTTSPVSHQVERLKIENEDLNQKLRKTRLALNENTARLRELYKKLSQSEILVKDLYLENTRLMKVIRHHFNDSHSISVR